MLRLVPQSILQTALTLAGCLAAMTPSAWSQQASFLPSSTIPPTAYQSNFTPGVIPVGFDDDIHATLMQESTVTGQPPGYPPGYAPENYCPTCCPADDCFEYHFGGKGRGYYINDQRIEFTGLEETFLVEGVLDGGVAQQCGGWRLSCETELFLNQPFERNILQDNPVRESFAFNFEPNILQISQLYLAAEYGDWKGTFGRFATPFGRYYYPIYRNNFDDSPFIRSEAIIYRETGLMLEWTPGSWSFAAALTNGSIEGDTNSSKALVARAGYDGEFFACGASYKAQDGTGSENQKNYKSHVGVDAMVRMGRWSLSTEAIYDQYGLRRPFPIDDIFWGRSLYWRDINKAPWQSINGYGYYVNLQYDGPAWSFLVNYGEFFPEELGVREHDQTNRRGLAKLSRHWTPNWESYGIVMVEPDLDAAFGPVNPRKGIYYIFGAQFSM